MKFRPYGALIYYNVAVVSDKNLSAWRRLLVEVIDRAMDVGLERGHFLGNGVDSETRHDDTAEHIQVSIVDTSVRSELIAAHGHPHEQRA